MTSRFEEYVQFKNGAEVLESFSFPAGSVKNSSFSSASADRLAASKVVHRQHVNAELAEQNTAVAAIEKLLFIADAAGTLESFKASVVTVADDASRTVTVDLHKSTSGGAFATVLSATADFSSSDSNRTAKAGTISSTSYVAGDIFKIVVTVAGASGNQAKGLVAVVAKSEDPS